MATVLPNTKIKKIVDDLPGRFFITDTRGIGLYANKAMESRTGFALAQIIGSRAGKLWGGHMDRSVYDDLWKTLQKDKKPYVGVMLNRRRDKGMYREHISIAPVTDAHGNVQYYAALMVDKESEQEQDQFQELFLGFMEGYANDARSFSDWVLPALGKASLRTPSTGNKTTGTFLKNTFIDPTLEQYQSRGVDKVLVLAAKEDLKAFSLIYEKYREDMYNYFFHRTDKNSRVAEDLVQETFYRAMKYLDRFTPGNASYKTYLTRIAHNLLVNHYRKQESVTLSSTDESAQSNVEQEQDALFSLEQLWKMVSALSATEQDVLKMKYKEELSVREIADVLGKSENAVKLHLSRARKKLRNQV